MTGEARSLDWQMTAKAVTLVLDIPPKTDLAHQCPESTRIVAIEILGRCLEVLRQIVQGVLHGGIELETVPTRQTGRDHDLVTAAVRGALATRQLDRVMVIAMTIIVLAVMAQVIDDLEAGHRVAGDPPRIPLTTTSEETRPLRNRAQDLARAKRQRKANLMRWVTIPRRCSQCNMQYKKLFILVELTSLIALLVDSGHLLTALA